MKNKQKAIGCRVTPEVYKQVVILAKEERWSLAKLSEIAVEFYLEARNRLPAERKAGK